MNAWAEHAQRTTARALARYPRRVLLDAFRWPQWLPVWCPRDGWGIVNNFAPQTRTGVCATFKGGHCYCRKKYLLQLGELLWS